MPHVIIVHLMLQGQVLIYWKQNYSLCNNKCQSVIVYSSRIEKNIHNTDKFKMFCIIFKNIYVTLIKSTRYNVGSEKSPNPANKGIGSFWIRIFNTAIPLYLPSTERMKRTESSPYWFTARQL